MALIPCKVLIIVFNNHHGGFLSFFFWVQWASLIGPWLQGNIKISETLNIPPNRSLYTQNQILVMNWNTVVVWEPTRIFWTRPPPTRQCWVLIFTSCKTAYIAGGDKVTANNYGFGTRSTEPARCEAHWKHAIRGSQWHYQCCQEPGWSTGPGAHPQTCQATRRPILVQSTSTSALPHPLHPLPGIKAWGKKRNSKVTM